MLRISLDDVIISQKSDCMIPGTIFLYDHTNYNYTSGPEATSSSPEATSSSPEATSSSPEATSSQGSAITIGASLGGALLLVIVLLVLAIITAAMVMQKKKAAVKTFQLDVLTR